MQLLIYRGHAWLAAAWGFVRAARKVTLSLSINSERYRDGICLCAFIAESPTIMSSGIQTSVPIKSMLGVKPVVLFSVAQTFMPRATVVIHKTY